MAVTANQPIQGMNLDDRRKITLDGSITLYEGTLVFFERTSGTSEGYATSACDSGTNDFAGIAVKKYDNSTGSAGDVDGEVLTTGAPVLQGTGFTRAIVGDLAYASDNYTVTASASSTTKIGRFIEYISTTKMRVELGEGMS
jgi:hypothetical protein